MFYVRWVAVWKDLSFCICVFTEIKLATVRVLLNKEIYVHSMVGRPHGKERANMVDKSRSTRC